MHKTNFQKGFSLVEILVATSIFTIVLGSLISFSNMYLSVAEDNLKSTKGAYLAQEGIEAVKIMRDADWNNVGSLADNVNYYLYFDTSSSTNNIWKATTTASFIDNVFIRTFKLNTVYRDSSGRIITTGGTLDSNTKKVSVSVSWPSKSTTVTKTLSTYIANIL